MRAFRPFDAAAARSRSTPPSRSSVRLPAMQKWKYARATVWFEKGGWLTWTWPDGKAEKVRYSNEAMFEEWGSKGWELVSVCPSVTGWSPGAPSHDSGHIETNSHWLYFKRPVQDDDED